MSDLSFRCFSHRNESSFPFLYDRGPFWLVLVAKAAMHVFWRSVFKSQLAMVITAIPSTLVFLVLLELIGPKVATKIGEALASSL